MKTIKILALCLLTTFGYAQKKLSKTSQSIKVSKDVIIDLNTSHVEIQLETWNRDIVEVEAYIESHKLSDEELELALQAWNLKVEGSNDKVTISSTGGRSMGRYGEGDYGYLLKDLEFHLADLPDMPEIPRMPEMPEMSEFPELPEMPEMPELPELPEGITSVSFDYEKYQEEGEKYLTEWSKEYEEKGGKELKKRMEDWAKRFADSGFQEKMEKWGEDYGKRFEGKWADDMEKWGEKFGKSFGKDMEKWGEKFGEQFGDEWAEKMEAWGERFGKEMEQKAKVMEKRGKAMEKRSEIMAKRREKNTEYMEERREEMEERRHLMRNKRESILVRRLESGSSSQVRKVIKIKIPKKAKLKTNIRHGELKLSSVIYNMSGDISHSFLVAEHIDGGDTSINVSYSPVVIDTWSLGALNLNFVDKSQIKNAHNLVLNSKSSNINIENLTDTGIIDGSFGDLTISNLTSSFKNLNLVLENSDALINLPKDIDYTMYFKGNRSKYNNKSTTQKTVRNYPDGQSSNRTIIVNAKFSNVIIN